MKKVLHILPGEMYVRSTHTLDAAGNEVAYCGVIWDRPRRMSNNLFTYVEWYIQYKKNPITDYSMCTDCESNESFALALLSLHKETST